jgi:lipopolysaccharide exporter
MFKKYTQPPRWMPGEYFRNITLLAGSMVLGKGFLGLISPILSRLYTPEDFGKVGIFTAFLGIAVVAGGLAYENAIISAKTVREAAYLVLISMALVLPTGLVFAYILFILITRSILGFGVLPVYAALLLPLSMCASVWYIVLKYWFIYSKNFKAVSRSQILQDGFRGVGQIGVSLASIGWLGLWFGDIIGRAIGVGQMMKLAWPAIKEFAFPLKKTDISQTLRSYRKYPSYSMPSMLIDTLGASMPLLLISRIYGAGSAGQYSLVQMVFLLPMGLVVSSVADAFHSRISSYAHSEQRSQAFVLFLKTAMGLFLVGVLPTALLMIFGSLLFPLLFGANWQVAGNLAVAMAPWMLAALVVSPLSRAVYVFQAQELKLIYDIVTLTMVIGVLLIGSRWAESLVENIKWLSLAQTLAYGLYFAIIAWIIYTYRKEDI